MEHRVTWIRNLRSLRDEQYPLWKEIRQEYLSRKCRDFCNDYGIGVTSALLLFWRKRRELKTPEEESIRIYKESVRNLPKLKIPELPNDEDPYYRNL